MTDWAVSSQQESNIDRHAKVRTDGQNYREHHDFVSSYSLTSCNHVTSCETTKVIPVMFFSNAKHMLSISQFGHVHAQRDIALPISSVCPSVQCSYCVYRNAHIVTTFWLSNSDHYSSFVSPTAVKKNSMGTALARALNNDFYWPWKSKRDRSNFSDGSP